MKKYVITEDEKSEILNQYNLITEGESSRIPENRRMLDVNISSMDFARFKSKGLTPYYFNKDLDDNFGFVEMKKPIKDSKPHSHREVFLLTQDEYNKGKKLSDSTKKIIELYLEKIELLKQYVPSALVELMK